jgi:maltose/moltooligosaccharide transporter
MGVSNEAGPGVVPDSVKIAFAIGAFVFLVSILITVFTTDEYPPEDMARFRDESSKGNIFGDILHYIRHMPPQMLKIGIVQFFSWFAFFTMWNFAAPALAEFVYGAAMPAEGALNYLAEKAAYNEAVATVGSSMGMYGLSSMAFAFLLTLYTSKRAINRRLVHVLSLAAGGAGFLLMTTATAEHMTTAAYNAYADRIDALFNARIITDDEHTALSYDLLDRADAYGEMDNLRIIDGLLATYEAR